MYIDVLVCFINEDVCLMTLKYLVFSYSSKLRTPTITSSILDVQSPEADTSAPPPPPIVIHMYKSCQGGPLINVTQLPATIEDISPAGVVKKLISELLSSSNKAETVLARLGTLRGEEVVISHDGITYTIKLPSLMKTEDLENAFIVLASSLGCCQNLFSKLSW